MPHISAEWAVKEIRRFGPLEIPKMLFVGKMKSAVRGFLNRPYFATNDVKLGTGVSFGRNVKFNCKSVRIGDGVIIGDNVTVDAERFEIGDFGTIYRSCFFPGPGNLRIGHNFWLGTQSIVDAQGGTAIGNNVGVGGQSQLWTHMKYGDVCAGCRFHSAQPLIIEDDVWLVGHVLVSPVHVGARSLVMLGAVVVSDVPSDRTYAGVPAKDMTEKFGPQFKATTVEQKEEYLQQKIKEFSDRYRIPDIGKKILLADSLDYDAGDSVLLINVADRTYRKRGTGLERKFLRFLLPDAKFVPASATDRQSRVSTNAGF